MNPAQPSPVRVALLGGKPLSGRCLLRLHEEQQRGTARVVAIVCRPAGSRGWWSKPGVVEFHDQAESLRAPIVADDRSLLHIEFDLGISVLYWKRLSASILARASMGFYNLHCAPLPAYRGCNGCSHAVWNGESRFAATLHAMTPAIDQGDVVDMEWFDVPASITARGLMDHTESAAHRLFDRNLALLLSGDVPTTPQEEIGRRCGAAPNYYSRNSLEPLRFVDLDLPEEVVRRRVRALEFPPFEPAHAWLEGKKMFLTSDNIDRVLRNWKSLCPSPK